METYLLVGVMALLFGFSCVFFGVKVLAATVNRHRAAAAMQDGSRSVGGLLSWRLRNGFAAITPLARLLLRIPLVSQSIQGTVRVLSMRGLTTTPEAFTSVVIVCLGVSGLLVGACTGSLVAAVAAMATVCVLVGAVASNARERRQDAIREAIPDALESMSVCFGSGFTLLQTFRQVSQDVQGPLGSVFARCYHMLEMGSSAQSALEELKEGAQASELAFVAVALDVQHQSGGAMRQVLDAATEAVKGELALRRSLRVQTAQAKLSARVVSVMPLILVTAFSLASPDFLMPFFTSPYGYALLVLAIVMQVAGIVLVRRALSVEGVS